MKRKLETKRGITLISLVITIILLLILATVAISLAVDSDGLFSKAGEAANKWNTSVAQEDAALQNLMTMLDEMDNGKTLGDVYNDDMIGQSVTYSANGQEDWIILGEDSKKAGNILITTKAPVADGFTLNKTVAAWLSYEDDLHAACSVYGGTIGGIEVEARSITMEDINAVTGFEEPEFETYTFGTTQDFANKKVNYLYPKAGSSWTNSSGTAYSGWKLPSAENETTFDCDVYRYNDSQYVYFQGGEAQVVETTEHIDPIKGDIIWGTGNDFAYVAASRSVGVFLDSAVFDVGLVGEGYAYSGCYLYFCGSGADSVHEGGSMGSVPVRPVVSVPLNIPMKEVDGVYDFVELY